MIPKQAKKATLGIINYSSVFTNNSSHHQYNLFVSVNDGFTENKYIDKLINKATEELKDIYQIEGEASYFNHKVWHKSIPQFNVGHSSLMKNIDDFERNHTSIKIIGNWRTGVAIVDCIHV